MWDVKLILKGILSNGLHSFTLTMWDVKYKTQDKVGLRIDVLP